MGSITPAAAARVREICSLERGVKGVRVSLRQRGCSGMSYVMDYHRDGETVAKTDEVVPLPKKQDPIAVAEEALQKEEFIVVDGKAVLFLIGTEMDYVEVEMGSEFVFQNPNSKGSCGCGQSFNV